MQRSPIAAVIVTLAASSACATGEEIDDLGGAGFAGYAGFGGTAGSSAGGSGGISSGGFGALPTGGTAGMAGAATGGVGGSGGGVGGSGATASGGSSGTSGTGGLGGTGGSSGCGAPNTCSTATPKGSVTGDDGTKTVTVTGMGSLFVKLRVTEDNHSVLGEDLELAVALTVPSGADLDVYGYVNESADISPCGMQPRGKSDSGGTSANESFKLKWGEGTIANGSSESRDVVVEVRQKSGTCSQWTLKLTGDP